MNPPISTRTHRMVDCAVGTRVMCVALMLSPFFFRRFGRRYSAVPVLLGAVGFLTSLLAETPSPNEHSRGFTPSRELSEAVADPDVARTPHLRSHLE